MGVGVLFHTVIVALTDKVLVLFLIVMIICFNAIEFQRRVMELLVAIHKSLEALHLSGKVPVGDTSLPARVKTVEELAHLDDSLSSTEEKQKLVGFTTVAQQFQNCSIASNIGTLRLLSRNL